MNHFSSYFVNILVIKSNYQGSADGVVGAEKPPGEHVPPYFCAYA